MTGEERNILREIWRAMEDHDQEEVVVKVVKELKKSPAKSVKSSEWSMENVYCTTDARSMFPDLISGIKP